MRIAALVVELVLAPLSARAQAVDRTRPDPIADALTDVRLSLHAERREAGIALFAGGLASVVAGAMIAGVGFLLVCDLVEWIASSARADRVAAVPSVRW